MAESSKPADISVYSEDHIHPSTRGKSVFAHIREAAEHIHVVPLFSPEYCRKLIDTANSINEWESGLRKPFYQPSDDNTSTGELKNGFSLENIPGAAAVYTKIIDDRIAPPVTENWDSFEMRLYRTPYIIRYAADDEHIPSNMPLHWDQCAISMFISLNEDYEGGGTRFPTQNFETGRLETGTALIFPGGIGHPHEGMPVTRGKRYVLIGQFF